MFKIIKSKGYDVVFQNFLNLALVQGINLVLPLLTIPFITRKIGIESVGIVALATSVINYFGIIVSYGFNLSATNDLAQNLHNKKYVNQLFCDVTYSKSFLSLILTIVFFVLSWLLPVFNTHFYLYITLFFSVIFTSLTPDWFFQGVQKMKFITRLNVILKIFSTIAIFIFLRKPSDYIFLGIIPLFNYILLFLVTHIYIQKNYNISYLPLSFKNIFSELNKGKFIFLSQVKITFFSNFNIVVLGILTNNTAVGVFSSADKIIKVFSSVQVPVVTALFPHFAQKIKRDSVGSWYELNKIAKVGAFLYFIMMVFAFLFASKIAAMMFGTKVEDIALLIRIMCIVPIFVFLNNLYGTQYLLNTRNDKKFLLVLIFAAVTNVVLIFPLAYNYGVLGVSYSVIFTELVVLIGMYLQAKKVFEKLKYSM